VKRLDRMTQESGASKMRQITTSISRQIRPRSTLGFSSILPEKKPDDDGSPDSLCISERPQGLKD